MTTESKALAEKIKQVMEFAKHKVFVEGYDDIIRQLVDIVTQQHEALDVIRDDFVEYWYGESGKSADLASIVKADATLALSAPIVNMKKGG
jgi:hypothetical protein